MAIRVDADEIFVDWWTERDRTSIVVYKDLDREHSIAEWWDEDAQQMMEDGFFKWRDDESVIDYLDEIGLIEFINPDE